MSGGILQRTAAQKSNSGILFFPFSSWSGSIIVVVVIIITIIIAIATAIY